MKSLTAIDGRATLVDQELVAGVEMLCVESAVPSDHGLTFTHAGAAFAPSHLPAALRVSLILRSERPWGTVRDQSFDCADRHVVHRDAFLRRTTQRIWALRNIASPDGAS